MEERKSIPNPKETSKRLFASAIFVSVATWVIFFSPAWIYLCVTIFFIVMALNEYVSMALRKGVNLNRGTILALGALAPLALSSGSETLFLVFALFILFVQNAKKEELSHALATVSLGFLGIMWISWLFSYIVDLRYIPNGRRWVFYAIAVAKMGDAGAYFVGKRWGKTSLIPRISPNKTWEGAIGQLGVSLGASLASLTYLHVEWVHLFWLGLAIGVIAQVGDFVESAVKRNLECKDSGAVPGLGGFLDILDSLLFTIPIVFFYATYLIRV